MSDTKWTAIAAVTHAAAAVVATVVNRNRRPDNDVALHERVRALELKVERMENNRVSERPG